VKKLAQAVAAIAMGAGLITATAVTFTQSASAATSCAGSRVESRALKNVSGTTLAWLNVYWDGTYDCVQLQSSGATWGVKKYMDVGIDSCPLSDKGKNDCHTIDWAADSGSYSYYAGPRKVNGVNKCITAFGSVQMPDDSHLYQVFTSPYVGHC
jgi:hypothetical protein